MDGWDGWKGEHQKSIKGSSDFFFSSLLPRVRSLFCFVQNIFRSFLFDFSPPLSLSLFKVSVSYFFLVFGTSFFDLTRNSYKLQRPAYDYVVRVSLCVLYRFLYFNHDSHTHPWASRFDFIIYSFLRFFMTGQSATKRKQTSPISRTRGSSYSSPNKSSLYGTLKVMNKNQNRIFLKFETTTAI